MMMMSVLVSMGTVIPDERTPVCSQMDRAIARRRRAFDLTTPAASLQSPPSATARTSRPCGDEASIREVAKHRLNRSSDH